MKMFIKILFLSLFLGSFFSFSSVGAVSLEYVDRNDLLVSGGENSANESKEVTIKDNFLKNIQSYMIGLLGIISVTVFIIIGYNLFTAHGKEEDFKNAWKALIYAVVGLAVMPLAYILVKIVTGFTL